MNFSNITDWIIPEGSVTQVTDSLNRVIWQKTPTPPLANTYFYVEDISGSANTLTIRKVNNASGGDAPTFILYKSTDQTNWSSLGYITTAGFTVTIPANSKVYFRANTTGWSDPDYPDTFLNYMRSTSDYKVGGNIMSLLKGAGFYGSDFTGCNAYCLHHIFSGRLIDASNLILPSTTLIKGCYSNMFRGCTGLTAAPTLPATTLADYCYAGMFNGSTNLNSVTTYAQDISADGCLTNWLNNVAASGDFYNLGGATYPSGTSGIPSGWTEHTTL